MIEAILKKLIEGKDLTETEMGQFILMMMEGRVTPAQIGAFLAALRIKGETISEITGAAKVMMEKAYYLKIDVDGPLVDTCGTGGALQKTFNVSTVTAFVIAGTGLKVAKHGNRSAANRCGSADVLEALGLNLDTPPAIVAKCIKEVGIGFLFAPKFHPAIRFAVGPRSELGVRTVFNLLGPLTNPAGTTHQVIGVYDKRWLYPLAEVVKNLGLKGAMIVHGEGGYDEITITAKTYVAELKGGQIRQYEVSPEIAGLKVGSKEDIKVRDEVANASLLRDILSGKEEGSRRDMVLLNAAAVFQITDIAKDWQEGVEIGLDAIRSGKALEKLEKLLEMSR
jgi:anthranilate phosphoribosyltransferase